MGLNNRRIRSPSKGTLKRGTVNTSKGNREKVQPEDKEPRIEKIELNEGVKSQYGRDHGRIF